MKKKTSNLREAVLDPQSGYRSKTVPVPEWNGIEVTLREPSAEAWIRWREIMSPPADDDTDEEKKSLTPVEEAERNLRAGVVLLIDVLRNDDGSPAFTMDDFEEVLQFYGPVHNRLVNQASAMANSYEEAEKK